MQDTSKSASVPLTDDSPGSSYCLFGLACKRLLKSECPFRHPDSHGVFAAGHREALWDMQRAAEKASKSVYDRDLAMMHSRLRQDAIESVMASPPLTVRLRQCLQMGVDPNSIYDKPPAAAVAFSRHLPSASTPVDSEAPTTLLIAALSRRISSGVSQLQMAEVVRVLLEAKANPNHTPVQAREPLYLAAVYVWDEAAKLLMEHGADPFASSQSPLFYTEDRVLLPHPVAAFFSPLLAATSRIKLAQALLSAGHDDKSQFIETMMRTRVQGSNSLPSGMSDHTAWMKRGASYVLPLLHAGVSITSASLVEALALVTSDLDAQELLWVMNRYQTWSQTVLTFIPVEDLVINLLRGYTFGLSHLLIDVLHQAKMQQMQGLHVLLADEARAASAKVDALERTLNTWLLAWDARVIGKAVPFALFNGLPLPATSSTSSAPLTSATSSTASTPLALSLRMASR